MIEEIHQCAEEVWEGLPSSLIARDSVLALWIARLVIANKGKHEFLKGADCHCFVCDDFIGTKDGVQ